MIVMNPLVASVVWKVVTDAKAVGLVAFSSTDVRITSVDTDKDGEEKNGIVGDGVGTGVGLWKVAVLTEKDITVVTLTEDVALIRISTDGEENTVDSGGTVKLGNWDETNAELTVGVGLLRTSDSDPSSTVVVEVILTDCDVGCTAVLALEAMVVSKVEVGSSCEVADSARDRDETT